MNEPKRSSPPSMGTKKSFEGLPKGFIAVPIPEHVFHVKMYSQTSTGDIRRAIFDMQKPTNTASPNAIGSNPHLQYVTHSREPRRRRSRALFSAEEDNESMDLDLPVRKQSRQVTSSVADDEIDDLSSHSSPNNSQNLLFAATNIHNQEMNTNPMDHRQLMGGNGAPYSISATKSESAVGASSDLFYSNTNNTEPSNSNTNQYIQHAPFPPADHNNLYPSPGTMNTPPHHPASHRSMHVNYDPAFVQSANTVASSDMGLVQPGIIDRPHSVTFGMNPLRNQSKTPLDQSTLSRPPSNYPSQFNQLQSMMDDNNGK